MTDRTAGGGAGRRRYLGRLAGATLGGLAGCVDLFRTRPRRAPPVATDRPEGVYLPTHVERLAVVATAREAGYACALAYTYPHRYWLVENGGTRKVRIGRDDTVHLLAVVWLDGTGIVPPGAAPRVRVERDGTTVAAPAPPPMLSQPMGPHFGANVELEGNGTYEVTVAVDPPSARRAGALAGAGGPASFRFAFEFTESALNAISYRDLPASEQGNRGAVPPIEHGTLPDRRAPDRDALAGDIRGTAASGDARFVVAVLEGGDVADAGGNGGGRYLAVSARTPYNRYPIPRLAPTGTLRRDGTVVHEGPLRPTLDPGLGYHYGATVPEVAAGDELSIAPGTARIARHEGYETAFLGLPETRVKL